MSQINSLSVSEKYALIGKLLNRLDHVSSGCWVVRTKSDKERERYRPMIGWTDGKRCRAHRLMYDFFRGPIPYGMHVLHRCDNPACVRPSHLFLGTHADNMEDMRLKRRCRCGENHPNAFLDDHEVLDVFFRYHAGGITQAELARQYKVARTTVNKIVRGDGRARVMIEGLTLPPKRFWHNYKRGYHGHFS